MNVRYLVAIEHFVLSQYISRLQVHVMVTFKIPFEAEHDAVWRVLVGNDPACQTFPTRLAAIRFAMQRAASLAQASREETRIVIEGADGHWRRFDAAMTSTD